MFLEALNVHIVMLRIQSCFFSLSLSLSGVAFFLVCAWTLVLRLEQSLHLLLMLLSTQQYMLNSMSWFLNRKMSEQNGGIETTFGVLALLLP